MFKKLFICAIIVILLSSHLCGCALFQPKEMVEAINQGQSITIEVAQPSTYTIAPIKGEQTKEVTWIQLDQLKTFNDGFRQGFDKLFNITIVTENGLGGKSGCLYINPNGERDGNTTIKDAFRNKPFNVKYWGDAVIRNEVVKLGNGVYVDLADQDEATSLLASLNAYYNLLNDSKNPDAFNPTQSLTREEFYTLLFKSEHGVYPIDEATISAFTAITGETEYSRYASQIADKGWLQTSNKSLDQSNISGNITRLEAVYMVVNTLFPEELAKVQDSDKSYSDIKNAGDLALKAGFKEQVKVEGEQTKHTIEKDRWQAYSLSYSLQNPQKGVQRELYKATVVAHNLQLLPGEEMRWDETISKGEAMELILASYQAQNQLYGYLTEVENGRIVNNFQIQEDANAQSGIEAAGSQLPQEQFELVYNKDTGIYEPVYIGDGETTPAIGEQEKMTPKELEEYMNDTSGLPSSEELDEIIRKQMEEEKNKNQGNGGNQDQTGGQPGNTGGQQGQTGGTGGLTPEQQAKRDALLKELREEGITDGSELDNGGATHDGSGKLPSINWNK